jgi:hypothetical protein
MYVTAQPAQPVIRLSAPMSTPAHHAGLLTSSLRRKVLILLAAVGCKYYYLTVFGAGQRAAESTQGMRERGVGGHGKTPTTTTSSMDWRWIQGGHTMCSPAHSGGAAGQHRCRGGRLPRQEALCCSAHCTASDSCRASCVDPDLTMQCLLS